MSTYAYTCYFHVMKTMISIWHTVKSEQQIAFQTDFKPQTVMPHHARCTSHWKPVASKPSTWNQLQLHPYQPCLVVGMATASKWIAPCKNLQGFLQLFTSAPGFLSFMLNFKALKFEISSTSKLGSAPCRNVECWVCSPLLNIAFVRRTQGWFEAFLFHRGRTEFIMGKRGTVSKQYRIENSSGPHEIIKSDHRSCRYFLYRHVTCKIIHLYKS